MNKNNQVLNKLNSILIKQQLLELQATILNELQTIEDTLFIDDHWIRPIDTPLQGEGMSCLVENGSVFERGGCNFSHVLGKCLPPSATQRHPHLSGLPFEAMGISLVLHPKNPYVPTVHLNIRLLKVSHNDGSPDTFWFGGGMDLTPYYGNVDDVKHFHNVCKQTLIPFGEDKYPRFKTACDDYFYLKHRQEARGVGGIFFDDFSELGAEQSWAMTYAVGCSFLSAYMPILKARHSIHYGEREREFQAYRRGRYVEFNLIFDRGTLFGLQSGGRTESILMSMPPVVHWKYNWTPQPDTPEALLYTDFLPRRDWV